MDIAVITLFPEMFESLEHGIVGRAIKNELINISFWNPREYSTNKHRTVDDRPYGGGPGMVMMVEPLKNAIAAAKKELGDAKVIYLSPQGKLVRQENIKTFSSCEKLIFIAGRYEGIDERLISLEVDEEWSIGDYVLSGGEIPAMVIIDAITRLLPGALGHEESAKQESFEAGLLDCPHYTRPEVIEGLQVPEVLLSGDHAAIEKWRHEQSLERTKTKRPDLLEKNDDSAIRN